MAVPRIRLTFAERHQTYKWAKGSIFFSALFLVAAFAPTVVPVIIGGVCATFGLFCIAALWVDRYRQVITEYEREWAEHEARAAELRAVHDNFPRQV